MYFYKESKGVIRYGLIAQDVLKLLYELTGHDDRNVGFIHYDNNTQRYSLSYSSFISPMIKSIQQVDTKVEDLKKEIQELKSENKVLKKALCSEFDSKFSFCK